MSSGQATSGSHFRELGQGERLPLRRGEAAVCVPVYGAYNDFAQSLRALARHTPPHVPLLVADDASPDPAIRTLADEVARAEGRPVAYLRAPENRGFVNNVNTAFEVLAPADVVLVNSDCVVSEGWFEGLRDAAHSDSRVATASALTNAGTIVSVPHRNRPSPLPQDWSVDEAASRIREGSQRLRPRIPTAIGHCVYVRRAALDLAGPFDASFSPGYEEEVDFSQRCVLHGMSHVVADDVFVQHYGGATFGGEDDALGLRSEHHDIISARYPYYDDWVREVADDARGPLARSLGAARRAMKGFSVTIDGAILAQFVTGTQVHVLEVISALDEFTDATIRVLVPPDLGDYAKTLLGQMPDVELLPVEHLRQGGTAEQTDVVHRPYQVLGPEDLDLLGRLGSRLVVTQQDLISYSNPAYHKDFKHWRRHRRLTRTSLARADHVVFFSGHAAEEALTDELVDPQRASVVYLGTDHRLSQSRPAPELPRGADDLEGRPFLLCLGTDYLHKNRLFAIKLLQALRERGWDGMLAFAGAHVPKGSSAGEEAAYLATHPELEAHVRDLVAVDEAGKAWLLDNCAAIAYPSTFEGFGLVPFEAAEAEVPCLFASQTSLAELFPSTLAPLVPWDEEASADRVLPLLTEAPARDDHVRAVRAAGARLTWSRTARELVSVYEATLLAPAREASVLAADSLALQSEHHDLEQHYYDLKRRHDALDVLVGNPEIRDFVGAKPAIDPELRHMLLTIAYKRPLRILVFGPIRLFFRAGRALGRPFRRGGEAKA